MATNLETCIEPYLAAFVQSYAVENVKPQTLSLHRRLMRCFGALLDEADIEPSSLTLDCIKPLTRNFPRGPLTSIRIDTIARRFVEYLIDIGLAQPVPPTEAEIAHAKVLADFEAYLDKQRGLSPRSVRHAMGFARRFLDFRFSNAVPELGQLCPADAIGFIEHVLIRSRRDYTVPQHVRAFLRYLFTCGVTETDLSLSVPSIAKRGRGRLPRHLPPDQVDAVLASVRENRRHGARDYAMLALMARLGLRAAEVIAIQLDDIDWRAGELLVRGKGKLHDRMPIGVEVGEALSRYLREERGPASCRTLFVTDHAPYRPFKGARHINKILKDGLLATGQQAVTPYVGSHLLRHSLANQLVNTGASLGEVGDVLRHRKQFSTMTYARLDIDGLRSIARPWPVAGGAL